MESYVREQELERLVGTLITMLGRSNERVIDLTKRLSQLEAFIHEVHLHQRHQNCLKEITQDFLLFRSSHHALHRISSYSPPTL